MMAASWRQIVHEYSGLSLTLASDQLPAISGVERPMSKVRNGHYFGGIRKNVLVEDVVWHTFDPKARLSVWRAPSWSWASVDIQASYPEEFRDVGDTSRVKWLIPRAWNYFGSH
jgi:hypothetical protein